ncbi:hypothetical protein LCGC14_1762640 [marine sediment metagenome]|uniref:Uncharacterized protein n=1 Tax=marine sediment metagenome TaxID=412755 RepID=A0A0F9HMX6_9ZZZZ
MTWKFEPKPDITAYELALLRTGGGLFYAYDEDMEGDGEGSVPKPVRRHFRKLPKDSSISIADAAHRASQWKDGNGNFPSGWRQGLARWLRRNAETP